MPIKDYDATTSYDIKEVRDYDATTYYKIKEVCDYDATTNYLIYNAQSPETPTLLNDSDQVTSITGGWTIHDIEEHAYMNGYLSSGVDGVSGWGMSYNGQNKLGQGWMVTKNKVNISGWNYLRLNFYFKRGYGDATAGAGNVYIALTNTRDYVGGSKDDDSHDSSKAPYYKFSTHTNSSGYTSIPLDVSAVDGEYYIQVGRYNESSYQPFSTMFQKVELL